MKHLLKIDIRLREKYFFKEKKFVDSIFSLNCIYINLIFVFLNFYREMVEMRSDKRIESIWNQMT